MLSKLKKLAAGVALTAALVAPAQAEKLSAVDRFIMGSAVSLLIADASQTSFIVENGDKYRENNPLIEALGKDAIVPYFVAATVLTIWVGSKLEGWQRKAFLLTVVALEAYCVIHNHGIGVQFSSPF